MCQSQGSGTRVTGMSFKLSQNEPHELYTQSRLGGSESITLLLSVLARKGRIRPHHRLGIICQVTSVTGARAGTPAIYWWC